MVIAYHLMFTGYGHWLPNDPRGSMSRKTHTPELAQFGKTHHGRKSAQPSLGELREFSRRAEPRLAHPILWFDPSRRRALVEAIGSVVRDERLTCYACAVLTNHVHVLIRKHRLRGEQMRDRIRQAGRDALHQAGLVPPEHPVFSERSCIVYKDDPASVGTCIHYINDNFAKHRLAPTIYEFVVPYDNWPFHKQGRRGR